MKTHSGTRRTNERKNDPVSLLMLIASTLIFGSIGIFRRYIPLTSAMLACFRGFSGALFLLLYLKLRGRKLRHNVSAGKVFCMAAAGAAMGINWILLFEAYNYTTIATATLCYYMEPTIVILVSPLIFKEKLTGKRLICAALSIAGMILVSGIAESGIPTAAESKGIVFGLGAALLYALVVILNKKLPGIDAYEKTIIELLSAAAVLLPYIILTENISAVSLDAVSIIMLLTVGLIHTGIAYALYFGSMDGLKTQSIAILSYIDPVTALCLSAIILHEKLSLAGLIGAALILASAVFGEIETQREDGT